MSEMKPEVPNFWCKIKMFTLEMIFKFCNLISTNWLPTMSQILVMNKPGRVPNVCIQETYSFRVANKISSPNPILSSISRKVICLTRILSNYNWDRTHQHRIMLEIGSDSNSTPLPPFLCSNGHLSVFGWPKHFPFLGIFYLLFHLSGIFCFRSSHSGLGWTASPQRGGSCFPLPPPLLVIPLQSLSH